MTRHVHESLGLSFSISCVLSLATPALSGCSDDSSADASSGESGSETASGDGDGDPAGDGDGDGDGDTSGDGDGDTSGDGDGDGDTSGDGDGDTSGDGDGDGDGDTSGDGDGDEPECVSDEDCDDADQCNGYEVCELGTCLGGSPPSCDDGVYCNGIEACDPEQGCIAGMPLELDDGVGCTADSCDEENQAILHEPDDGPCNSDECGVGTCDVQNDCQIVDNPDLVCLTGDPDPATVFDVMESTYFFSNNLCNQIWNAGSDTMLTANYNSNGYWNFAAGAGDYPAAPDNDLSKNYCRLVHMPATNTVITGLDRFPVVAADIEVGTIDPLTGALSGFQTANFSDDFNGQCNLQSASATEFLCYDGGTEIRVYATNEGSADLDYVETITLSQAPNSDCAGSCWGGTFAWDGAYFYMPFVGGSSQGDQYQVYEADGSYVDTYDAVGGGNINSTYFDWSVGRYTTHDGYGDRWGGVTYTWLDGNNPSGDSQVYGPASATHE